MKNTSLVYIERDGAFLMLLRNKKKQDENKNKWIGVGGKFEEGESPEDCMLIEVKEETGLELFSWNFRGIVTFVSNEWGTEYMHLFTAKAGDGALKDCDEGELHFIKKEDILGLELWEGDRIFLNKLFKDDGFFSLKLIYEGDKLVEVEEKDY